MITVPVEFDPSRKTYAFTASLPMPGPPSSSIGGGGGSNGRPSALDGVSCYFL
jgi:hypothetical protein